MSPAASPSSPRTPLTGADAACLPSAGERGARQITPDQRAVPSGTFAGYPIRTARKAGKCADFKHCGTTIQPGDRYVEGDSQYDIAGGFGHERLCLACAGVSEANTDAQDARTYRVVYHYDFHRTGLDWRIHFYGAGHWCRCDGQHHAFTTEAEAEAAGRAWVATGRMDCKGPLAEGLAA